MISEREHQKPTKHSNGYVEEVSGGSQPISTRYGLENYDHSTSIVFFGTDEFSATSLQALIESNYNIAAVVTKPDSKSGRGQRLDISIVKKLAIENNISVWQPNKVLDINEDIQKLGPDVVGVLVSYGKIIPKSTIELFNPGVINVHPSLLPMYRGPSPIESAIENGDAQTGVSIMQLTPEMDAGPVYGRIIYELSGNETRVSLRKDLAQVGAAALLSYIPGIIDDTTHATPQDENDATYCKLLSKDDAWLKPEETSAIEAERQVRAHLGFPKTKVNILGHCIVITKAHISKDQKTLLDVRCQDDNYLSIDELIAPSGRAMLARDFLNGYT